LNSSMQKRLKDVFDRFANNEHLLERGQLADLWRYHFNMELTPEQVDGFCDQWDEENTGKLDIHNFESIVSRLVRKHQHDYALLVAFDELAKAGDVDGSEINIQDLVVGKHSMDPEAAAEMLWATDWMEGNTDKAGTGFTLPKLVAALVLVIHVPKQALPPVAKLCPTRDGSGVSAAFEAGIDVSAWIVDCCVDASSVRKVLDVSLLPPFNRHSLSIGHQQQRGDMHLAQGGDATTFAEEGKKNTFRGKVFILLDDADSSPAAMRLMLGTTVVILFAILVMILESVQAVAEGIPDVVWANLELFFTVIFTLEYVIRLLVADALGTQTTLGFVFSPANICDVAAVAPFYIEKIAGSASKSARLFRMVRLMRVARLSRLSRLAKRHPLVGPCMLVMMVIWGIYMKEGPSF